MVNPIRSNQNLRVFWKPVNLQDCVWVNLYRLIMKTISQEKETIHCNITIWFTNLFLCPKPWKSPQQRQQWTRNGQKLEKISAWNLMKVGSKKEVIDEARTKGAKVHFASLMDICHLINTELEAKHQKCKGRVVLPILWKTILDLMQYLLNKVHQHHKWQQQKSWISSPDCLVAQDKQLTQSLLKTR